MEEELQKLGLSEHEAKVYLAALSLGPSSATQISGQTNIKRPTVYLALENLAKQGLVLESFAGKKRLFEAEKPQKLEKLTKRMRRQVVDAEILLDSILPGLIKLPKQYSEEPKVSFYSGVEGLKNVALEISASKSSWHFFGSGKKILEKLVKSQRMDILHDAWALRGNPDRPKIYIITDEGVFSLGKEWKKIKTPWREMKILPGIIAVGSGLIIYEDKVAILSLENKPFVAVIKSKEVVEVVKVMFRLIWKSLPTQ
jgi:HTH-type transcriptional regulator, sugar sensing transcriptional regulator